MKRGLIIKFVVFLLLGAVVLGGGWYGFTFFRAFRLLPEAYAAWDSGALIIAYMQRHEGRWPGSWDDLRSVVEADDREGLHLQAYGLEENGDYIVWMSEMVAIDWSADPNALRTSACCDGEPPFEVITRADGREFPVVWEGAEPNEMVWRYLNNLE